MNKYLEKIKSFKLFGKNENTKLILLALIALFLMFYPTSKKDETKEVTLVSNEAISNDNYIENEEKRIEEFIMGFGNINKVKVLLSMDSGKEKILAKETNTTQSQTQDSNTGDGGMISKSTTYQESTIYKNDDNPYVLKETEPSLRGVIILIDGNITLSLISDIKEAMKAYLDLPINKVQVYKMKG